MIGVFDSGVGGLSVWRCLRAELPDLPLLYFADQAHVPYGSRPASEIQTFCQAITHFLLRQQVQLVVVACNTATAAALNYLRQTFPHVPFVGMEPALKPAVQLTRTGKIGVLATATTFQSQRYASLMARFAQEVELLENPCVGLVELIERGELESQATRQLLEKVVEPMCTAGVDTLILGCTHYPFVLPLIQQIAGSAVQIVDPAPAVARQTRRVWQEKGLVQGGEVAPYQFFTSGRPAVLQQLLPHLIGKAFPVQSVTP